MKKKTLILSLMFIMMLSLSACAKKEKQETKIKKTGGLEVVAHKSLKDWFKKNKAIQCKIKSSNGDIVVSTKGKDVYMEGIPYFDNNTQNMENVDAKNGAMLTIGDWTYMWDKKTKKGTKMNNKEMGSMGEETEENNSKDINEMVEEWDNSEVDYECEEISPKKALFNVPQDVEFKDLTEMMKGLSDIGKNLEEQMKGGNIDTSNMNLDELKDKIKDLK